MYVFKLVQPVISSYYVHSPTVSALTATPQLSIHHTQTHTHILAHLWHFNHTSIRHFSAFFIFDYTCDKPLKILFLSLAKYHAFHSFVRPLSALLIFSLIFLWIFINSENGDSQ